MLKEIANARFIYNTNITHMEVSKMEEHKYHCTICGQIVTPLPDGSCPICGAPREMLKPYIDKDDEQN